VLLTIYLLSILVTVLTRVNQRTLHNKVSSEMSQKVKRRPQTGAAPAPATKSRRHPYTRLKNAVWKEPLHTRVLSEVRNTSRWIDGVDGIDKKGMSELDVRWETHCHTRFLSQNRVLIVCMTQDHLFHTYGQKCSQITKCHNIEYN
jgi:hypothetical protein